jgi:Domain of unknown function (DUF4124)
MSRLWVNIKAAVPTVVLLSAVLWSPCARADIYKCVKDGKVEYANSPCEKDAKSVQLKGNVTVLKKEAITGKADPTKTEPTSASGIPSLPSLPNIKPPDPIGDCKKKGGTFDPEFRACKLP